MKLWHSRRRKTGPDLEIPRLQGFPSSASRAKVDLHSGRVAIGRIRSVSRERPTSVVMNNAQENRLALIANEISLGFTFIKSAQLAYSMEHIEHGDRASRDAEAAYKGAQRFLEGTINSSRTTTLRKELERLRVALDALQVSLSERNPNAAKQRKD